VKDGLTDDLLRQMATCHTAANEFLRQFWLSKLAWQGETALRPEQRYAKAIKMAGYLSTTHERVRSIMNDAKAAGVDASAVEKVSPVSLRIVCAVLSSLQAMSPLLVAVDRALYFQASQK
jgi:transcription initiation factor TFIIH subunit 1